MENAQDAPLTGLGRSVARPTALKFFGKTAVNVNQESVEYEFFRRVVLPNGTLKTTLANRLDDLNQAVLPYIARIAERPVKILDVGISSGVSTLEWHDQLLAERIMCDFTGTDLTIYASLVSLARTLSVLIDGNRNILHMDVFGRGAPPIAEGLQGIFAGIVRMLFRGAMIVDSQLPPLQGRIRERASGRLLTCQPVTLLSRRLAHRESLCLLEEDLLAPEHAEFKGAFHVVRAANILNHAYFSDSALAQIIRKLRERLKPNGLLIVCRTDKLGGNHATVLESTADSTFRVLLRLGDGSEVEELLTAV
jgi:SAM-dependent methyltransferase